METYVHESGHDERYKCIEMQCQNTDNQGARSSNQETHMKRNKNPIYDCYSDIKGENKDILKYAKGDNQETAGKNNQT